MFGERLKELRKECGLNQTELGNKLELSTSSIGMYEQGRRDPDSETFAKIAEYFSVSVDYLLGLTNNRKKENENSNANDVLTDIIKLPVLGKISAGLPVMAIENIEGHEFVSRQSVKSAYEYFFLKVNGDSMNLKMQDGDRVLVQRQENIENGEIAIVMVNGSDATIKKFYRSGDIVTLIPMSSNPEYTPQVYNTKDTEVRIIGRAVRVTSDL